MRINGAAIIANLKMEMRAGGLTGRAHIGNQLTSRNDGSTALDKPTIHNMSIQA